MKNLLNLHDKTKIIDIRPVANKSNAKPATEAPTETPAPTSENMESVTLPSISTEDNQDILLAFEKLSNEETALRDEKNKLNLFKEQLMRRIKEEIDIRHRSVAKLKDEITNAKTECEKLVRIMESTLNSGISTD
jgi:predicted RNase H-like nuclease (RuvC/YqgF family)